MTGFVESQGTPVIRHMQLVGAMLVDMALGDPYRPRRSLRNEELLRGDLDDGVGLAAPGRLAIRRVAFPNPTSACAVKGASF